MKLCYIEGNFAYFTNDLSKQWGDDWNDIPYEHNAGEPYEHQGQKVVKLAFVCELSTPAEIHGINSPYSVQDINEKRTPWLSGTSYESGEYIEIYAGTTMDEFIDIIHSINGEIYQLLERENLRSPENCDS